MSILFLKQLIAFLVSIRFIYPLAMPENNRRRSRTRRPEAESPRSSRAAGTRRSSSKRSEAKKTVTIRLSPDLVDRVDEIADAEQRTKQFLWEDAITAYIKRYDHNKRRREARAKKSAETQTD